jgi:hypothetical protein
MRWPLILLDLALVIAVWTVVLATLRQQRARATASRSRRSYVGGCRTRSVKPGHRRWVALATSRSGAFSKRCGVEAWRCQRTLSPGPTRSDDAVKDPFAQRETISAQNLPSKERTASASRSVVSLAAI